jgi:hypothetical protein
MENHGKLQQETDQELVIEPISTFDCTQYLTMSQKNVPKLNFGL